MKRSLKSFGQPPQGSSGYPSERGGARLSLAKHEVGIAADVVAALSWRIQACRSAAQPHDVRSMLNVILDSAMSLVACDAAGVYVLDSRRRRVKYRVARGYGPALAKHAVPQHDGGPVADALLTGQAARVDVQAARTIEGRSSAQARVVIPITGSRGFVLGAMDLISDCAGSFDDFAVDLLTVFAAAVASSIDSARLYRQMATKDAIDRDLRVARGVIDEIASSTSPALPGFDVCTARETSMPVGGDYGELLPVGGGRWALVVADVSGKGVSAALFVAAIRAIVWSSLGTDPRLRETLLRVNRFFMAYGRGTFVTLFYGLIDVATRSLTYMNAGHHPPILLRANGAVERLDMAGLPLGFFDTAEYQEAHVTLDTGDILSVHTDGVVEATNELDEQFGDERLIAALRHADSVESHAIANRVFAALRAFAGRSVGDDRTLVLIRAGS